jgi:hypothetical protein
VEKEAPCGRLRVDAVGDALEMYLLGFKFIDQVYQSFHAAPEPILPGHKGVGFAQLGQSLIESRTPDLRAAEFVGENAFASCFLERVQLHFEILVMGGHSGVSDRATFSESQIPAKAGDGTQHRHNNRQTTVREPLPACCCACRTLIAPPSLTINKL